MAVMSEGLSAPLSSMKSPKFVSSLSPTGAWSEIGCCHFESLTTCELHYAEALSMPQHGQQEGH
jgi:hypothetical protein